MTEADELYSAAAVNQALDIMAQDRLGISARLPKRNYSHHKDYRDYYDAHTQKLVADHFAEDIDLFGYTFG
ncbi:hypothetical protein Thini_4397 [Thiothrix nivea DSM 5205]|uniref:Sulfotransferase n=2 Tax=Thiothrix nivea TaxID=1031 RepID=A0A656HK73_THINJ|nr:hypothetical protein Thini_4397 [Thiothrix nivea DSM 5205]